MSMGRCIPASWCVKRSPSLTERRRRHSAASCSSQGGKSIYCGASLVVTRGVCKDQRTIVAFLNYLCTTSEDLDPHTAKCLRELILYYDCAAAFTMWLKDAVPILCVDLKGRSVLLWGFTLGVSQFTLSHESSPRQCINHLSLHVSGTTQ